jgi:L-arabinose isomerase
MHTDLSVCYAEISKSSHLYIFRLPMKTIPTCRTGLFGVGLETYWPQFEGLKDHLIGYQSQIAARLGVQSAEVLNVGLVDSPAKAREAASTLGAANLDIVFLYVSTYALSSTVLPVVQRLNVPVIVLNLQPVATRLRSVQPTWRPGQDDR